jgi:hypothetical protein
MRKEIDIEIKGSNIEPKGISFEIISLDKNNEFYNQNVDYINKSKFVFSLNLELKEEDLSIVKQLFYIMKSFTCEYFPKLPIETLFRLNGKKISLDGFIRKDEKNNFQNNNGNSSNNYLNIGIKTGIDLKQIFSENVDHFKNFIDFLSAIIRFKAGGAYLNGFVFGLLESEKNFKILTGTFDSMFKKIYDFMKVILMPILKAEFKFEYDA